MFTSVVNIRYHDFETKEKISLILSEAIFKYKRKIIVQNFGDRNFVFYGMKKDTIRKVGKTICAITK